MRKAPVLAMVAAAIVLVGLMASSTGAAATAPTVEHFHFTSDPFTDNICGIDVIGVDTVTGVFSLSASGASLSAARVMTVFTNPESGKSITFTNAGVAKLTAPSDNGDGTSSVAATVNGLSPKVSELHGPPLAMAYAATEKRVSLKAVATECEHGPFASGARGSTCRMYR